jgi:hypothetical protein
LGSWGTSTIKWRVKKQREIRTFDHLGGSDGIFSTLQVAGCIVEHEEALGKAICLALKDVDRAIDLGDECLRVEIPIAVLAWFEHDVGLFVG